MISRSFQDHFPSSLFVSGSLRKLFFVVWFFSVAPQFMSSHPRSLVLYRLSFIRLPSKIQFVLSRFLLSVLSDLLQICSRLIPTFFFQFTSGSQSIYLINSNPFPMLLHVFMGFIIFYQAFLVRSAFAWLTPRLPIPPLI